MSIHGAAGPKNLRPGTCRDPLKGVAALVGSGTVDDTPAAVAAFLREHVRSLDRCAGSSSWQQCRWGCCRPHLQAPVITKRCCSSLLGVTAALCAGDRVVIAAIVQDTGECDDPLSSVAACRAQLGEFLGHHEAFALGVMHGWVDAERLSGLTIDAALRVLLCNFRLPGARRRRLSQPARGPLYTRPSA